MEVTVFEGALRMGDGKDATMVFAQDFRLLQCANNERRLTVACEGVEILGPPEVKEISSHAVYLDDLCLGRISADHAVFPVLPALEAGRHRIRIEVSTYPGPGLCDDFTLKRVIVTCR